MRLRDTLTFVLPAALLASACGGGTPVVVNDPETPEAQQPASGTIAAPPPGHETTVETEGPDGEEKEVHIETEAD